MPLWWNWQTRLTQNQVGLTPVPVQFRPAAIYIMKKAALLLLSTLLFLTAVTAAAPLKIEKYYDPKLGREVDVVAGEVLVKYKPGTARPLGVQQLSANVPVAKLLEQYQNDPTVEYAEPNFIVRAFVTTPNDTDYALQWALPQIHADDAWDITRGSAEAIIAIIDSGIDKTHTDLSGKQTADSWDYVDGDADPDDAYGHGTHVSGIAGANTNNATGVAGVSWGSKLMNLRVLDAAGSGSTADMNAAIIRAADNGAKVINLSLGSPSYSINGQNAVNYAYGKGCIIFAAAGNDYNTTINYPAGYDNVIGVAAVTKTDTHSTYSNYNSTVDLCAPGGANLGGANDIYSTKRINTYGYMAGTSMATPFVSGLAALVRSVHPDWSPAAVYQWLIDASDELGVAGRDDYFGYGRINARRATLPVEHDPPKLTLIRPNGGELFLSGSTETISWIATDEGGGIPYHGISIYCSTDEGATFPLTIANDISNSGSYNWLVPTMEPSHALVKIVAKDLFDNTSIEVSARSFIITRYALPAPTVKPLPSPTNVTVVTLEGTMTSEATVVLVNDSAAGVTLPTATTWAKTVALVDGTNMFRIRVRNSLGAESAETILTITAEAVTFSDSATGSSIVFPVGSSTTTPSVSASVYSNPAGLGPYPVSTSLVGNAINFTSNVTTFSLPITITLRITGGGSVNPKAYYWDPAAGAWNGTGLTVTAKTGNSVSFQSTHLSIFGIFDVSGALSAVNIYPNPCSSGSVNFSGLSGSETINIYNLTGDTVISQNVGGANNWVWNAVNQSGGTVSRGIYYYVITQGTNRRAGKIAIL
jgi:thermitase